MIVPEGGTRRQRKLLKALPESKTLSEAMLKAGYSLTTAGTPGIIMNTPSFKALAEKYLPDDLLLKIHKEGLEANRVISANIVHGEADEGTNDFIEVPDHAVRHKFLDTAYKLKGTYAPEKTVAIDVHGDIKDFEKYKELSERYEAELLASYQEENGA